MSQEVLAPLPFDRLPMQWPTENERDVYKRYAWRLSGKQGQHILPALPSPAEIETLRGRQLALDELLVANFGEDWKDAAARPLGALFSGYPSMRNANAPATITSYLILLKDVPVFAIALACDDIRANRVKDIDAQGRAVPLNPDFPPSAPRIHQIALRHAQPQRDEQEIIKLILSARTKEQVEISPESRALIGDKNRRFQLEFGRTDDRAVERERKEQEQRQARAYAGNQRLILAEYAAKGYEPVPDGMGGYQSMSVAGSRAQKITARSRKK